VAGCSDDDEVDASDGATATTAPQPAPGDTSAPPGPGSTATPAPDGEPTTAPPATGDGGDGSPPATLDATGPAGSFATALLGPDASGQLVVELHVDGGAEPSDATVDHVVEVLGEVAGKPVSTARAPAPGGGDRAWTASDLAAAADAGAVTAQGGGDAVVRLLFVHGTFEGDDGVLGVAVRGDVAAVFMDRVAAAGGLLGGSGGIEAAVATHELGHLLGLVDLVLDTGREDPEHPGHSTNEGSVMYWAVESDLVGQLLGADPPADFDADDRADLAAIAGG
jgi:hypothetical protein